MGAEWLKIVPTIWDGTRVVEGEVGEYIVVARRSGRDCFLGAMAGSRPRELKVGLGFLGRGTYTADIWKDGPDADKNPAQTVREQKTVNSKDSLEVRLAPGGGMAVHFRANK